MISVFFFCTRKKNLEEILETYQNYEFINEILVVHLYPLTKSFTEKFSNVKFIYMDKKYDLGLLSRYTFALSCKNRYVFIQDDDWVFSRSFFNKVLNSHSPLAGHFGRWFSNGKYYRKKNKALKTAPIILTTGVLVDTIYLPDVIKHAKRFWQNYQNVFNGEDIFLSVAYTYLTGIEEFPFFNEKTLYKKLSIEGKALSLDVNSKQDRSNIARQIYEYFKKTS